MEHKKNSPYDRIIRDCFWDMDIKPKDISHIIHSGNFSERYFLFEKILLNSTQMINDLSLFEKSDLKKMLEKFKIPRFNHDFASRRKNMAEVYFFDKPLTIDELKWIA